MITLRRVTAILLIVFATAVCAPGPATSVVRRVDPTLAVAAVPDPAFRLGNAGGRFGVSTAIADFNEDGRPDAIVADRLAPGDAGYQYRIAFTMSGHAPEQVTFDSIRDAVAITVSDVDRDNDLDVVARAVLSGETVGLWLNDGHGHFTSADARLIPAVFEATQTVDVTDTPVAALIAATPPTRAEVWLPEAFRAPPVPALTRAVVLTPARLPHSLRMLARGSRAPPSRTRTSLA